MRLISIYGHYAYDHDACRVGIMRMGTMRGLWALCVWAPCVDCGHYAYGHDARCRGDRRSPARTFVFWPSQKAGAAFILPHA